MRAQAALDETIDSDRFISLSRPDEGGTKRDATDAFDDLAARDNVFAYPIAYLKLPRWTRPGLSSTAQSRE